MTLSDEKFERTIKKCLLDQWFVGCAKGGLTVVVHVRNGEKTGDEESGNHCVGDSFVYGRTALEVEIEQTEADVYEQTAQFHENENELKSTTQCLALQFEDIAHRSNTIRIFRHN